MFINHPPADYQGIPADDVCFVSSDQHVQLGYGYVIRFLQNELYPEQPELFFLQLDAQSSARSMLYGALYARACQLHSSLSPARLYTQLSPEQNELLRFFEKMGLKNDDSEDLYSFYPPFGSRGAPMGFEYWQSPLANLQDETALLERINRYRIQPVSRDYLTLWRQQEHFLALAYYRQGIPACECVVTGAGNTATLLSIYTLPQYRRQGMASRLIESAGNLLRSQGVSTMYTHIFKRNQPQAALIRHLKGQFIRTVNLLPGVNLP